jgi:hypothetical protein
VTTLARRIEKALAAREPSALERTKLRFAAVIEFTPRTERLPDEALARRRIAECLALRLTAHTRMKLSRAVLFARPSVPEDTFTPRSEEIDVIGADGWSTIQW